MSNAIVPEEPTTNERDSTSPENTSAPNAKDGYLRLAVFCALLLGGMAWWNWAVQRDSSPPVMILGEKKDEPYRDYKTPAARASSDSIKVHVAGQVKKPGLYSLPASSRVADAIAKAGGALKDADVHSINLAQYAEDGARIEVPRKETELPIAKNFAPRTESAPRYAERFISREIVRPTKRTEKMPERVRSNSTVLTDTKPVDINRADAQGLMDLPGVGPVMAQRILEHREENGPFRSIDDLDNVKGIGPAKLEKMRAFVVIR